MAYYWTQEQRRRWHEHQGDAVERPSVRRDVERAIAEAGQPAGRVSRMEAKLAVRQTYPPHVLDMIRTLSAVAFQRQLTVAERSWLDMVSTFEEGVEREAFRRVMIDCAREAWIAYQVKIRVARLARAA